MDEKVRKVTANITGRYKGVPNPILDKICRRTPAGTIGYECELLSHISSLEEQLNNLQSHANRMGEAIHDQTMKRIELEGEIEELEKHPKLELAFQHRRFSGIVVNNRLIEEGEVIDYIIKLEDRIQSLEEGIEELIAYGMPKHIELGLKELIEKK